MNQISLDKLPSLRSRHGRDRWSGNFFLFTTGLPLLIVILVIGTLARRVIPILETHSAWELLSGMDWHPVKGHFGYFPFIAGTVWVTVLAMIFAIPPSILSAIYLAEYARPRLANSLKPVLDILAGIPSVVYGVWGMVAIVPWVRNSAAPFLDRYFGWLPLFEANETTGFSVLAGGLVLAVMVIPVIVSVTFEVLGAVPDDLRKASLALGATRMQTIFRAVLRKAAPGMAAGIVLGFSRAFGETMAVLMVVGNVAKMPSSIFDPAYPLTALIANNYGEMMSIPKYDSALMGAALVLLLIVLGFNLVSAFFLRRTIKKAH